MWPSTRIDPQPSKLATHRPGLYLFLQQLPVRAAEGALSGLGNCDSALFLVHLALDETLANRLDQPLLYSVIIIQAKTLLEQHNFQQKTKLLNLPDLARPFPTAVKETTAVLV